MDAVFKLLHVVVARKATDGKKKVFRFLLTDQNAYTNLIAQLPKDYCLIPGNRTIKLVETKNLL